jgi:ribosomal protein L40E
VAASAAPLSAEAEARRAQLELLGLGDPGQAPIQQARGHVVPYRSSGAPVRPTDSIIAGVQSAPSAIWAASSREVASAQALVGVQACRQCGLSLSATARFCRRCGSRQAQSA